MSSIPHLVIEAQDLQNDVNSACDNIANPTFHITTMTIALSLDVSLNLTELATNITESNGLDLLGGSWVINTKSGFFNSILISKPKRQNHQSETLAIKIFSNGSLHMTGIKLIPEAVHYGWNVSKMIFLFN